MIRTNEFNQKLYYLGRICKYNHVFPNTNNSLRQRSNRTCIECQKNINHKYKQSNSELCNERTRRWRKNIILIPKKKPPGTKRCVVCFELKAAKEFYTEKYSAGGLLAHCISCDKKRQKNYRDKKRKPIIRKDPELIKENKRQIKRRYKKSIKGKLANTLAHHRRKAILKNVESKNYSPTQILKRFTEFDNKCVYCESDEKITIDHFIPVSKSGADRIENIVPACVRCNSSKNNKNPREWYESKPFFSLEKWKMLTEKLDFSV